MYYVLVRHIILESKYEVVRVQQVYLYITYQNTYVSDPKPSAPRTRTAIAVAFFATPKVLDMMVPIDI